MDADEKKRLRAERHGRELAAARERKAAKKAANLTRVEEERLAAIRRRLDAPPEKVTDEIVRDALKKLWGRGRRR